MKKIKKGDTKELVTTKMLWIASMIFLFSLGFFAMVHEGYSNVGQISEPINHDVSLEEYERGLKAQEVFDAYNDYQNDRAEIINELNGYGWVNDL